MRKSLALALLASFVYLPGCSIPRFLYGHDPNNPLKVVILSLQTSVPTGATLALNAVVTGNGPTTVTWTVNGVSGGNSTYGTITQTGLYASPDVIPSNPLVTVTATSTEDTSKSGSIIIQITPPTITSVNVVCSPASILNTQTAQCSATVQGNGNFTSGVAWSVNNIAGGNSGTGTISPQGLYQAPDPIPSTPITISATSQQDNTTQGTATVSLAYPVPVLNTLTPNNLLWMGSGGQIQIAGSNFSHASTVYIGTTALQTAFVSSSQLTAIVPASALLSLGTLQVAVSTAGPGGGTSANSAVQVIGGSIALTVNGLPSAAITTIQVSGPQSFNKSLAASGTLTGLAAGTYTITAATGSTSDSTFKPDQAVQSVSIVSLTPVSVTASYSTGVFNNVKVLDADGMSSLVLVPGQQTLMVNQVSAVGVSLQAGDVLVIPDCTAAPGGAVIKVTTASLSFDQVVVDFTPGNLTDVLSQVNLQLTSDLTADALPYISKAAPGVSIYKASRIKPSRALVQADNNAQPQAAALPDPCQDNWLTVELDGEVDLSASQEGEYASGQTKATASGTLQICPIILLTLHKDWAQLPDGLKVEVKFAEYGQLGISDESGVALGAEKQLFELKGIPIPIGPPGTPINLQPVVTATIGATGSVNDRFVAGGEQTVTGGFGVNYQGGTWTPFVDPIQTADALDDTQFAANASTEVYIKARIALDFNAGLDGLNLASVGVYVEPKIYVDGNVDTTANPWWSIHGGIDEGVGVTASVFDLKADYPGPVTNLWDHVIKTAGGPLPASPVLKAITPATPIAQAAAQNINLAGTGFVSGMTLTTCLSSNCPAVAVTNSSSTSASASVVLSRPGSWTFQLQAPGSAASSILRATVLAPAVLPEVIGIAGASSSTVHVHSGNQTLTITGTGFADGLEVQLCGVACYRPLQGTQIASVAPTQIVVYATLGQSGPWTISVINPDGGTSTPYKFTVQPAFSATVSPASGVANTTQFTISGVGATPNGTITRVVTLPNGSKQSSTLTADASGAFGAAFTVAAPGPYVETFVDAKTGTQTPPLSYSAVAAPAGSYTLSTSQSTINVTAGSSGSFTLTATSTGGFTGAIAILPISIGSIISGTSGSWSSSTLPGGQGTSTFSFTTSASTPAGTFQIPIQTSSGTLTESTSVTVVISAAGTPSYTISMTGSGQSIAAGHSAVFYLYATSVNGFSNTVNVPQPSMSISGASGSWSPASISITPSNQGVSALTVSTSTSTPAGTYTIWEYMPNGQSAPVSLTVTSSSGGTQGPTSHFMMSYQGSVAYDPNTLTLVSPSSGNIVIALQSTSTAGSSAITSYYWTSGGNLLCTTSTQTCSLTLTSNVAHNVDVTLNVTDANGKTNQAVGHVVVSVQQVTGPTAHFTMSAPGVASVSDPVTLTLNLAPTGTANVTFASTSTAGSAPITSYVWKYGTTICGYSSTCTVGFGGAQSTAITLTVTDANGKSSPASGTVVVSIIPAPHINSVTSPIPGSTTVYPPLTITGTNFSTAAAGGYLIFTDTIGKTYPSTDHPERIASSGATQWIYNIDDNNAIGTWHVVIYNSSGQPSNSYPFCVVTCQ